MRFPSRGFDTDGTPGILVQIDELDKTYVSNSQWKVSSSPSDPSWKNKNFNDENWAAATAAGNAASLPHGESLNDFAANSQAQWIWSADSKDKQARPSNVQGESIFKGTQLPRHFPMAYPLSLNAIHRALCCTDSPYTIHKNLFPARCMVI